MDFGVRRYGFHGTSHQYVSNIAMKMLAESGIDRDESRLITCHLGNGCSITAIQGGNVVDTSMGLTPAEGLVMGTRAGDIDPAIVLFLQRELECDSKELDNIINKKSGLLGVSGISSDMRDIEAAADRGAKRAQLALAIFCYRIKKYIGAYAAVMGGVDAIVFTGGIGENSAYVRAQSVCGLEYLGAKLNMAVNAEAKGLSELNESDSAVKIYIIPTNEEVMIARQTAEVINS
ncbi:MAG: acetate/propionate family kinase, partial [Armatimonadota bacterium]